MINEEDEKPKEEKKKEAPKSEMDKILSRLQEQKIDEIIESATEMKKDEIVNFDEIKIRRTLFFRIFISGTIEYGCVINKKF